AMGRSKLPVILDEAGAPLFGEGYSFEYGVSTWAREGGDITIVTMGTVTGVVVDAADALRDEGVLADVCIVSSPLDLDDEAMQRVASARWVLVVEDHGWRTGLWASVAEWLVLHGRCVAAVPVGVDCYEGSGAATDLFARAGLDCVGIVQRVHELLAR
ncbi:MAG: transketolase C-terminal domain-containing protein, partial [Coriobacteriia bacterium]|nr:transketolase C-terminal domain-containing protein [Coriobacteriia bacterium]